MKLTVKIFSRKQNYLKYTKCACYQMQEAKERETIMNSTTISEGYD